MDVDIIKELQNVIELELRELPRLTARIDRDFKDAVEAIFHCKGKVILTGVGKSGIVAKKIAATMASTGTPAVFAHPAEGIHGDSNPVINISNSMKNCLMHITEK